MLAPTASGFASLAGLAALGSALAYAFVVVMVRVMAATETTASMVFWFLLMLALGAGALAAPGWVAIAIADWPWIVGVGLAGWAGQHLITEAFRLAPASTVAPYEYLALVWGMGIDWFVWRSAARRTYAGRRRDRDRGRAIPAAQRTTPGRGLARKVLDQASPLHDGAVDRIDGNALVEPVRETVLRAA